MAAVDSLVARIDELEGALTAPSAGKEHAWTQRVRQALGAVEQALGRRPAPSTKDALAPAAAVENKISPGLAREAGTLRHDHEALLQAIDSLQGQLRRDVVSVDEFAALQQSGMELVKQLRAFNTADNALILETTMGEPGAGD